MVRHVLRRSWAKVDGSAIADSWDNQADDIADLLSSAQVLAATNALDAQGMMMAEDGDYQPPTALINANAFGDMLMSGLPITIAVRLPAYKALELIGDGVDEDEAMERAGRYGESMIGQAVYDAGNSAAMLDTATRRATGYIRYCEPGACSRCILLAGKFYRWNAGFLRHPNCHCIHRPATEQVGKGLCIDPMEAFEAMSRAEQDRRFGKYSAQAIRDGADITQVVNARRGVTAIGKRGRHGREIPAYTTTGTGKGRGFNESWFHYNGGTGRRMTPEGIYRMGLGREETLELLDQNGYLLSDKMREWREYTELMRPNAGAWGQGGRSKSHTQAYRDAIKAGARSPHEMGTMTAAEQRVERARLRYEAAMRGTDQKEMAIAERDYRHQLATQGQRYTR